MGSEETLFTEAVRLASPAERAAYLDRACAGDAALRRSVEELLAAHDRSRGVLEFPMTASEREATDAAGDRAVPAEQAGSDVGRYRLLERIGEGGMGVVYLAEQTHPVRRQVALKIIKPGLDTREVIARFEAERQALALMDHPNIAKVLDAGATDAGRPYFVMELVKGIPVTEYCDKHHLTPRQRLELFVTVCQAVQHAHQKGIIHRDLKPTNVLVTVSDDGNAVPKVIDFGVAKATAGQRLTDRTLFTEFRQLIGTPLYMSPEQAEMSIVIDVDTRSDVYSLGVLLYELLTGTTPFDKQRLARAAYEEVRRIIREEEPPRPSTRLSTLGDALTTVSSSRRTDPKKLSQTIRGELDWIVMRALEKDRTRRYETANGLAKDVERYLNDEPVLACPPSRVYRLRKFARRNKAVMATTVLVATILVLATAVSLWQTRQAVAARGVAESSEREALVSKREAERQAVEVRRQNTIAQRRLAENYIIQVHGHVSEGNYASAKDRLAEAAEAYRSIGDEPLPTDLLSLEVYAKAPPPLNRFDTRPADRPEARILPDGRSAILRRYKSNIRPGRAELVDLRTGAVLRTFAHDHGISATALTSDGRLLLTGGAADAGAAANMPPEEASKTFALTLWDVTDGRMIRRFLGHKDIIRYLVFSRDGRRAISSSVDKTIKIWDVGTGAIVHDLTTDRSVNTVSISHDGQLFTTSNSRFPGILESNTGAKVAELDPGRARDFDDGNAAFLPDGRYVLSTAGPQIHLQDAQTGQSYILFTERNQAYQKSLSRDGTHLVAGSSPGSITHWSTGRSTDIIGVSRGGWARQDQVVVTPDGRAAVCPAKGGVVRVWDLATGLLLRQLTGGSEEDAPAIAISPDGRRVVAGGKDGGLRLWDLASGELIRSWQGHERAAFYSAQPIATLAFSPDGRRAVSGGDDALPKVWDLETGQVLTIFRGHHRPNPVMARTISGAVFTPDGTQVVSACIYDNEVRVWDAVSGQEQRVLISRGQKTPSVRRCLRWLTNDRLLSAVGDGTVQLTDLATGREFQQFRAQQFVDICTAASVDGRLVAAAHDGALLIWEGATGREVLRSNFGGGPSWIDFSPNGRYLVSLSGGMLYIRDLARPARYREFERILPAARATLQSRGNDAAALKVLGEWYAFRGVWDWAVEFLVKSRANGGDVSRLELARCYWRAGDREAAQREFEAAVKGGEAPRPYLELCLSAVAAAGIGPTSGPSDVQVRDEQWAWQHAINPDAWPQNPVEILAFCRDYVERKPEDSASWQVLGWALYRAGHYKQSVAALEKSIALQERPKGGDPWQWFFLAMAHAKQGDHAFAKAWYSASVQWLAENPGNDAADVNMMRGEAARVLELPERWPWLPQREDQRVYQRLLELRKDSEWARRQLTWVERSLRAAPATRPATTSAASTTKQPQ